MPPSFQPGLINDPSGDPGLFIPFAFNRRAIVFDLGDIAALSSRDALKISHVFVSHTHMDHFAGFDRLLRIMLGRSKTLNDHGDLKIIGNSYARYNFGFTVDGSWRGLDFSIFLQGTMKRDYWLDGPYFWGASGDEWQSACFTEHLD
nr:hypothetical protein [Desulfobacteraceae bacterium]